VEFGLDFIRNGRKIEISNKDLFEWKTEDSSELEYPIDDPATAVDSSVNYTSIIVG